MHFNACVIPRMLSLFFFFWLEEPVCLNASSPIRIMVVHVSSRDCVKTGAVDSCFSLNKISVKKLVVCSLIWCLTGRATWGLFQHHHHQHPCPLPLLNPDLPTPQQPLPSPLRERRAGRSPQALQDLKCCYFFLHGISHTNIQ